MQRESSSSLRSVYPNLGYRPQTLDTCIEADVFEFALLGQKSNSDRLQMSTRLTQGARQLCIAGMQHTHPSYSETELGQAIAQAFLGDHYPPGFRPTGNAMTWIQDSITLAIQLQAILADLEIPHYITGGVAASTYGEPRTTRDVDMVLALKPTQLDPLVQCLETEGFYVPGVEDVRTGRSRSLNITNQATIARADLILAGNSDFEQEQFNRRQAIVIPDRGTLYLASPEDLLLNKLIWSAQSQSEKQWRDILGILKVQRHNLDLNYLSQQADRLGLSQALTRAATEAGLKELLPK